MVFVVCHFTMICGSVKITVMKASYVHFLEARVAQFIIETTFDLPYSWDYRWQDQVLRL